MKKWNMAGLALLVVVSCAAVGQGSDQDEFKVKREDVFEFARQPVVSRKGDEVTIEFESKGLCDCTVAIEDSNGRILRHLASGVLGPKAPAPFQKDSRKQMVVWDGKDDQECYVDDKASCTVRVSLGLKPQFERTLFWSPKKRISDYPPLLVAVEEGVLVCEGRGVDFVRLFDHKGDYVRTVYPFPADKLDRLQGVETRVFPQDGKALPVKKGFVQASLLTSGSSSVIELGMKFGDGFAATGMAAEGQKILLADRRLNRLALDGTTGGTPLTGGATQVRGVSPSSLALAPDGKTLYLSGYFWREPQSYLWRNFCLPVVMKMDVTTEATMEVFAGSTNRTEAGSGPQQLSGAMSVAVDKQGRVYVADYVNNRVQIFGADGRNVKSISTSRPAAVRIHHRSQEIYVFSYMMGEELVNESIQPSVTRFGPFEKPDQISSEPLPFPAEALSGYYKGWGLRYSVELDGYVEPPRIWMVGQRARIDKKTVDDWGAGVLGALATDSWLSSSCYVLARKDGKWAIERNFAEEAAKTVVRTQPPAFGRQRLFVNPKDGKLYLTEDLGFGKSFKQMVRINPNTGKVDLMAVPFDSEDLAFDLNGYAYLRTDTLVVRYDSTSWREIPFDYGEEHKGVGFSSLGGGQQANVLGGMSTPGQRPVWWHQGGMWVNGKGHIAVCCASQSQVRQVNQGIRYRSAVESGKPYEPAIYPGRARFQEIHIYDKHGKMIREDVVPGVGVNDGMGMDKDDNLYFMLAACRLFDGKRYPNVMTATVAKFAPQKGRFLSAGGSTPVQLPDSEKPKRQPDVEGSPLGRAWAEGADWLYGGVGYSGAIGTTIGFGCCCWNARYNIDYFARSFAPEIDHYSVAVLDSNGNLILRVGRYGNVDDGKPIDPKGSPPNTRSLGGDEVGLFHGAYVATHTDRRLFISDFGNGRVLSVKLGYHADEKVPLKDVPDKGK